MLFTLKISFKIISLLVAHKTLIKAFKITLETYLIRKRLYELTGIVRLRANCILFNSTISKVKLCGRPPSNPSIQSTCSESDD